MKTATLTIPVNNDHDIVRFGDILMEAQRMFDVEKDEKNKAYSFIVNCGRFDEYKRFHADHSGRDHHADCVNYVEREAQKR